MLTVINLIALGCASGMRSYGCI